LVRVWAKPAPQGPVELLEDRLYATNLRERHRIRGPHILALVRAHWRIEAPSDGHEQSSGSRGRAGAQRRAHHFHGTLDIQMREDDEWWVRRGYGLINTGLLRAMAYNILAIARAVHLRRQRLVSCQQLPDWLRDALVWSSLIEPLQNVAPSHAPV
jgi:hypothetical protein